MPFEKILQEILKLEGAKAVVFLDAQGESIFFCGDQDPERLKLVGAYQSILLKLEMCKSRTVVSIYDSRTVLTHHLKDGYFLSVVLASGVPYSLIQFRLQGYYERIEREL
jgi:hypothetical protein